MNSTDLLGAYYKKVVDIDSESKVLAGLANLGVELPKGFRVVAGHLDTAALSATVVAAPVLDEREQPIKAVAGSRLMYAVAINRDLALTTATVYKLGLSSQPNDAVVDEYGNVTTWAADVSVVASAHPETGSSDRFVVISRSVFAAAEPLSHIDVFLVYI